MKPIKTGILTATAALVFVAAAPVEATWYSNNRGYWGSSSGWGNSGWGSSSWGNSGWGSPGYGTYASSSSGSTGGTSSSSSSNGTGGVGNDPPLGGTSVPEPSNFLMLGLGMAGLVAGRLVARRRKSKKTLE